VFPRSHPSSTQTYSLRQFTQAFFPAQALLTSPSVTPTAAAAFAASPSVALPSAAASAAVVSSDFRPTCCDLGCRSRVGSGDLLSFASAALLEQHHHTAAHSQRDDQAARFKDGSQAWGTLLFQTDAESQRQWMEAVQEEYAAHVFSRDSIPQGWKSAYGHGAGNPAERAYQLLEEEIATLQQANGSCESA
jgi:hypothetical protein